MAAGGNVSVCPSVSTVTRFSANPLQARICDVYFGQRLQQHVFWPKATDLCGPNLMRTRRALDFQGQKKGERGLQFVGW